MSTYGTAFVVDLSATGDTDALLAPFRELRGSAWRSTAADGGQRIACYTETADVFDPIMAALQQADGRAAMAIDYGDHGALWMVMVSHQGVVDTIHRRGVLNADPDDPGEVAAALSEWNGFDLRADDVPGEEAAAAAARVFEADEDAMRQAERESAAAYEEIGVVGGPFPWWEALGVPWPVPAAGEPVFDNQP